MTRTAKRETHHVERSGGGKVRGTFVVIRSLL